ncbi:AAA family ATPase [Terrimonas sp. NA20]|uniref:AAA family ATPase n=1 Tax=Terrimonas ginsenosidimutans TaxID=2908004 RepID=A0ABS9KK27_9BACT|nr:AAA family ATPase [Terrimonas ginsenosidimutans]MCG2612667.1 AAA family ATPase [Terrimonas ginsenosidimutans]
MTGSEQIKSLIKSFGESDEARFFASAMQIAASEARQGHSNLAQELKNLIENAKKNRSALQYENGKVVNISTSRREINDLVEVFHSRIDLSSMILETSVKQQLLKLIREQKDWELLRHHNLAPIKKLLLTGAPGTGKTMTAHALAGELGIPLFLIRLDGVLSKYLGESIAKLRVIFDQMPGQRGVYLFDEFDSIGSHRNTGHDIGEIKRILNSFLINIEKDNSNSIIIAATNLPESLDKALFRRFDLIISYPLPTEKEIVNAIKKCISSYSLDKTSNFSAIAKQVVGINYSDISKACDEAIKEKILSGSAKIHRDFLYTALLNRMSYGRTIAPSND